MYIYQKENVFNKIAYLILMIRFVNQKKKIIDLSQFFTWSPIEHLK